MSLAYEAEIARAFGEFYEKDLVYQALKSVRWCFTDRTALAEAELEYEERTDPAIPSRSRSRPGAVDRFSRTRRPGAHGTPVFALIWTTTPWTIPSNLAIAVHPDETYTLVEPDGRLYVVARAARRRRRAASSAGTNSRRVGNGEGLRPRGPPLPASPPAGDARAS